MDLNDLNEYLGTLITECKAAFRKRLLYLGLQGSYLRGEANENSDIDIMVILECFSVRDMDTYRSILKKVGSYEKWKCVSGTLWRSASFSTRPKIWWDPWPITCR